MKPQLLQILDGNRVAQDIQERLRQRLRDEFPRGHRPGLAIVLLKGGAASRKYAQSKVKACRALDMDSDIHDLSANLTAAVLQREIRRLAEDPSVHGLFVEHPLPPEVDPIELYAQIPAAKDVEGISYESLGRLLLGRPHMVASTAAAVMEILDYYRVPLDRKRAVVVGRSNIVGKPLSLLLLARGATVTTCHSHTSDLAAETARADVLVVSAGVPSLIRAEHVREGAVVVDVGINFVDGKMVGDVDFEGVASKAAAITPVPGGVGPVTTAMLLSNLVTTAARQIGARE